MYGKTCDLSDDDVYSFYGLKYIRLVNAIPRILILLLILSLFYNLKSEFNTRIHYKSIQRSINIPENRIRYTSGIYSIKAGLPSVGEVFKVSIQ